MSISGPKQPFQLRLPEDLRHRVGVQAEASRRSINAEIVHRLEASLGVSATPQQAPARWASGRGRRTQQQMAEDNMLDAAASQQITAVILRSIAMQAGGTFEGTAAEILARSPPGPGWPASVGEMQHVGLPEQEAMPGYAGVTVTRLGRNGPWRLVATSNVQG